MKRILLCLLMLCYYAQLPAQTRIYADMHGMAKNLICTIDKGKVFFHHNQKNEPVYYFKNNQLFYFDRFPSAYNEPLLTIEKNKIKLGDGRFGRDIIYTINRNTIHQGDGTFLSNTIIYSIQNNEIRLGEFFRPQILYSIEGDYNTAEVACLLIVGFH